MSASELGAPNASADIRWALSMNVNTVAETSLNLKCFTICLCICPDFDGYRAPKMKHWPCKTHSDMLHESRYCKFHDMLVSLRYVHSIRFTICLFISPDLDGTTGTAHSNITFRHFIL